MCSGVAHPEPYPRLIIGKLLGVHWFFFSSIFITIILDVVPSSYHSFFACFASCFFFFNMRSQDTVVYSYNPQTGELEAGVSQV